MSSGKSAIMGIAVIAFFIFAMLGNLYFDPANTEKSTGQGQQPLPGVEIDSLFTAQKYDYVTMYGDPLYWDDEKNLCMDTNGDNQNDVTFSISRSKEDSIILEGSVRQRDGNWRSMNFWSSDLYRLFRNSLQRGPFFGKSNHIVADDYVQISICDIDEDGSEEVLASVGNKLDENVTAIYELSADGKEPFTFCGSIRCDTVVEYRGDGILWAYRGNWNDQLYETYLYDGKKIKKVE